MSSIEFYFDFSSPYGYFASEQIDKIAENHNRTIEWHPFLMGAVMKITGRKPLVHIPMVDEYSDIDLHRCARLYGLEYKTPSTFPIATVAACRAFYWQLSQDKQLAKQLARKLFQAYFAEDRAISEPDVVMDVAESIGIDRILLGKALENPEIKSKLREVTNSAVEQKVFGSPFFFVDGEPFWGHDRIPHIQKWLETGGW